jgi:hypothetical protein
MDSEYTCYHFSQNNPFGPDQGDLPALLRRVADSIEELGEIEPLGMVMNVEVSEEGLLPVVTLYYDRPLRVEG